VAAVPAATLPGWISIRAGKWPLALLVSLILLLVIVTAAQSYMRAEIALQPEDVRERGFFGRYTYTGSRQIRDVVTIEVYRVGGDDDTILHLFAIDAEGKLSLRMRGHFWSRSTMTTVATHFDRPITLWGAPISLRELNDTHPEWLYWFKKLPRRKYLATA
jgi:hypothetical protein